MKSEEEAMTPEHRQQMGALYAAAPEREGQRIGPYEVKRVIATGGMGIVYEAMDTGLGRRVVLKMVKPDLAHDPMFMQRFRVEAQALAVLHHPHIVQVYALRDDFAQPFIVMEYVDGVTLVEYIKTCGPTPWTEALPLFKQLLKALGTAHDHGIIHRDLKPSNMMLTRDEEDQRIIKILDFGLAKRVDQDQTITRTQGTGGTLCYMSPEQILGLKHVDHRSDLFALGLTFYEVLAGCLPFDKSESTLAIMKTITEGKFTRLDRRNLAVPRRLAQIVMRALARDPSKRYQSAHEMLQALEALGQEAEAEQTEILTPAQVGPLPPERGWRKWAAYSLVFVVLSFFTTAAYFLYNQSDSDVFVALPIGNHPPAVDQRGDSTAGSEAVDIAALPDFIRSLALQEAGQRDPEASGSDVARKAGAEEAVPLPPATERSVPAVSTTDGARPQVEQTEAVGSNVPVEPVSSDTSLPEVTLSQPIRKMSPLATVPLDAPAVQEEAERDGVLDDPEALVAPQAEEAEAAWPEIFEVVEQLPQLIGGNAAIQRSLRYPTLAEKAGVEGYVFLRFVVDERGKVVDPTVEKGIGAGCDKEALRVVRALRFEPGRHQGRPVKMWVWLRIQFRMK